MLVKPRLEEVSYRTCKKLCARYRKAVIWNIPCVRLHITNFQIPNTAVDRDESLVAFGTYPAVKRMMISRDGKHPRI